MDDARWTQVNIAYPDEGQAREGHAVTHLSKILPTAEARGLITSWFFIRKGSWRVRYLLADRPGGNDPVRAFLTDGVRWTSDIYEPETHAFGGAPSMDTAHRLFHQDSHHLLTYLNGTADDRREHSIVLCTELMRNAGLDLNEQGDVWARISEQRSPLLHNPPDPKTWDSFTYGIRHLLTGRPRRDDIGEGWMTAFTEAGTSLSKLRSEGQLTRGIRAVIALHIIFHWNRIGIPAKTQAEMSAAARQAIFG